MIAWLIKLTEGKGFAATSRSLLILFSIVGIWFWPGVWTVGRLAFNEFRGISEKLDAVTVYIVRKDAEDKARDEKIQALRNDVDALTTRQNDTIQRVGKLEAVQQYIQQQQRVSPQQGAP